MLVQIFRNRKPDKIVAISHGLFAGTSIVLLGFQVLDGSYDKVLNLVLFLLVALIGFYMFYQEFFTSKPRVIKSFVPKPVAVVHALAAVIAFILLLVNYFNS